MKGGGPNPPLRQQFGFRVRRDIGVESDTSDGWIIEQNDPQFSYGHIDEIMRVRFLIQSRNIAEDLEVNGHSMVYSLANKASNYFFGPFIGITGFGAVIRSVESGVGGEEAPESNLRENQGIVVNVDQIGSTVV